MKQRVVLLVGVFRKIADPAGAGTAGLGGYIDDLLEAPYSLAAAQLKAWCDADPALRACWDLRLMNLVEDGGRALAGGSGEEAVLEEGHVDLLLRDEPAVVCFSAYAWNVDAVRWAIARLRARRPGVVTVVGGRAAEDPVGLLAGEDAPDAVIPGEAELPFAALLAAGCSPAVPVPGVWRREGGAVLRLPGPGAIVEDLSALPSPFLAGLVSPSPRGMMLELARGCPNDCGYCAWNACKTRRRRPADAIEADLRWAVEHGVRHVTIVDSALGYEPDQVEEFVSTVRRADPDRALSFTYNLRHELVTDAEVERLRELPAFQVLLGMETLGSAAMAESGRRPLEPAAFEAALARIARIAPPVVGVVLGLPGDDLAGFIRTMEYLGRLAAHPGAPRLGAVLVSLLQVFPGTALHARREALGLRLRPRGIPYLVEHPEFPRADLRKALRYLQWFRLRYPLLVKGPEGLGTLVEEPAAEGWALVAPLLRPWSSGASVRGWTLEGAASLFDGVGFGILRFRDARGREAAVRLDRRDEARPCFARTGLFNVYSTGPVPDAVRPALEPLMDAVVRRIRRNEPGLLAAIRRET